MESPRESAAGSTAGSTGRPTGGWSGGWIPSGRIESTVRLASATVKRAGTLALALILLVGCAEEEVPVVTIGGISYPAGAFESLAEPERQGLADLIAFGAAVAADDLASLATPITERAALRARLESLPYLLGARELGIGEDAVAAAYERAPEWELTVRHALRMAESGATRAERDSALAVATRVAERAAAGEDFAGLAAAFSEEPGAAQRGGLLDLGRRGSWVDAFWNAASTLQPGEVSGVVQSEYGYHVLKLDDRRPVPLAEADRGAVLRRLVSDEVAIRASAGWLARRDNVTFDPAAAARALESLRAGLAIPGSLEIARGPEGGGYTGADMAAGWAMLTAEERVGLERDAEALDRWLDSDAREVVSGREAEALGAPVPPNTTVEAERQWLGSALYWASLFGFETGMPAERVAQTAAAAVLSGSPDARAARADLRGMRPVLRAVYPVVGREE